MELKALSTAAFICAAFSINSFGQERMATPETQPAATPAAKTKNNTDDKIDNTHDDQNTQPRRNQAADFKNNRKQVGGKKRDAKQKPEPDRNENIEVDTD